MKPDRESASRLAEALDDEPDFATEHCDLTVGDRERGGPEGVPEPESPKGYGGADIPARRRPGRRRPGRKKVILALQEPHPVPAEVVAELTPAPPEPEPDFALEHRHLTAGGSDHRHTRRR